MRARNRLLAGDEPADAAWLSALEAQMAEHGATVAAARERTVDALAVRLADQPEGPFARAGVALAGWRPDTDDMEMALKRALAASRPAELAAGRTTIGPHRTDLEVTPLDQDQPAARSPPGAQKAMLLGTVLAHPYLVPQLGGRRPVPLLG